MKGRLLLFPLMLTLIVLAALAQKDAVAYPRYNDGCQDCHGEFTDNSSMKPNNTWPDSKHNVHRSDMLDNVCDACHLTGDNWNPHLSVSNGTDDLPGIGCLGCHGRYYDTWSDYVGAGLRKHHTNSGVTECETCHYMDPDVKPERAMPEYYGKPTVNITHPCNLNGSEDWTPDGLGLDNDGDMEYDGDDRDCFGPPRARQPVF